MIDVAEYGKINIGGREFLVKAKKVYQKDLIPDCCSVQVWGLPYCRTCEYLATEECGGYAIRKKILAGNYPVNGLPDVSQSRD